MNDPVVTVASLVASEEFQRYCLHPEKADKDYWEKWLNEHEDHRAKADEAKKWILSLSTQISEKEIKQEFKTVMTTIDARPRQILRPRGWRSMRTYIGIAASVLLLIASLLFWKADAPPPMSAFATDFGQTEIVHFPDGSELVLNANSTIRFAQNWEKAKIREAWLEGEGFFEVVHNPALPFILHTSKGDIKVLGTSFNAFQRSEKLAVTLIDGSVKLVLADKKEIAMIPGEQVRVESAGITHESIDIEPITAWKFNQMIFRDASIESIIERLKTEFNWKVEVQKPSILQKRVNAVIQQNDPEVLLDALAAIYDLNIEKIEEGSYLIK